MKKDFASMLVYAARYAHSRPTAAAHQVVSTIIKQWDEIDQRTQLQLVKESGEAFHCHDDWKRLVDFAKTKGVTYDDS